KWQFMGRVLKTTGTSHYDAAIAWQIVEFWNEDRPCYATLARLAREVGCDRSTAQRAVNRLAAAGLITVRPGEGVKTRKGMSNAYSPNFDVAPVHSCARAQLRPCTDDGAPTPTRTLLKNPLREGETHRALSVITGGRNNQAAPNTDRAPELYLAKH